jgi:hypothetical protein
MADQEPALALGDARKLDFYNTVDASIIPDDARALLTNYAQIPAEQVNDHVDTIRQRAFDIFPYPCIGMYRFLDLGLTKTGVYDEIIQRLQHGEHLLDLGCCFGQELRQLIASGAPPENLHGSDLRQEFVNLGYELFTDKGREGSKISWHLGNVFDDEAAAWVELKGVPSIVYTGAFFHLFDRDEQVLVAKRVVSLLKDEPNVLLLGRQVGNDNAGVFEASGYVGEKQRYRHNVQSWTEFWDEIGEATGTKWKVDAELDPFIDALANPEARLTDLRREKNARRLRFVVRRI